MCSDHPKFTTGGSVSNHAMGRGLDIASVDGEIVNPGSAASRELASELSQLPEEYRPDEIGSPWPISGPGYFTDAGHQDHLHLGFKQEIDKSWTPPADVAAKGGAAPAPAAAAAAAAPAVPGAPAVAAAAPVAAAPGAPVAAAAAVAPPRAEAGRVGHVPRGGRRQGQEGRLRRVRGRPEARRPRERGGAARVRAGHGRRQPPRRRRGRAAAASARPR